MLPQEIIRKKRNGHQLESNELRGFFMDYLAGKVEEYQMSAFLMATYFSGMTYEETLQLTSVYLDSGSRMDLSSVYGTKCDKHSTGGVGDKTSLLLVPIVAAAGVNVPMISGRGLGHTGGTLDKLESIPGFRTRLTEAEFISILSNTGMAMMGQNDSIVPLDKRIYSLRDVTATVEILPFIAASIMSKKIAGGADTLVLDIKTGDGAFTSDTAKAMELATLLVAVGHAFELPTRGFLTDMNEPLGVAIGNWLEIVEVVDCLQGRPTPDLIDVTLTLAGAMIHLGKKASSTEEGRMIAEEMLRSGRAYQKFLELVDAQGGDTHFIEDTLLYENARTTVDVIAERDGYISGIDARRLGLLSIELGAGRKVMTDTIDPTAGILLMKKTGDHVESDDIVCRLFSSRHESLTEFRHLAYTMFHFTSRVVEAPSKVLFSFDEKGCVPWQSISEQSG